MKLEHTEPFSLEHAKAGAPYCQRNGLSARIGIWDSKNSKGRALVGTLIYGNGDEGSAEWQVCGDCFNNIRGSQLVMLPLGYCEGKPVFTGDELQTMSGCIWIVQPFNSEEDLINSTWPLTAPVIPIFFDENTWDNSAIMLVMLTKRAEIEAYWKALDEFNKVKL